MIDAMIAQLKRVEQDSKPVFGKVEEALDLTTAMDVRQMSQPVAYVVEISRRPGSNERIIGKPMQNVKTTIGVVIGIPKKNDRTGGKANQTAQPILNATRAALFGFSAEDFEPLTLGNSDTIGVTNSALWKLERFETQRLEEAIHD